MVTKPEGIWSRVPVGVKSTQSKVQQTRFSEDQRVRAGATGRLRRASDPVPDVSRVNLQLNGYLVRSRQV